MKKIYKKSLYMLVAGALVASCADYNDMNNFTAEPDPSFILPYAEYKPIKSYIDREANPNLEIGATLDITEFNKQELSHAAVMTNFDNVSFGKSLMSGTIVGDKGIMNFINMMDLLDHMDEIGGSVFGSPIVANANQCDGWLNLLTAPIEITVDFVPGKAVDFNDYNVGDMPCTNKKTTASMMAKIANVKGENYKALNVPSQAKVNIIEGFEVDPKATYTTTFWAIADKDASFKVIFSDNEVPGTGTKDGKWVLPGGKLTKIVIESKSAEDATEGYLEIETVRGSSMNIQKVEVGYYPDNHIAQTPEQKSDTIMYALNTWCDGFMKINEGRIKSFDLIDEPIDEANVLESGIMDLKHSKSAIYWQDILGSENYAPTVAKIAREKFAEYGGDANELKLFIGETGLENKDKMESLKKWIDIWDAKGAKIDGITAKVNLVYYEDQAKQDKCKAEYEALLSSLANTGKLIRLANFDIKYVDADNLNVTTVKITDEQRQKLADFNAYAINAYMTMIPMDKQAGIIKTTLVDGGDPVGLWTKNAKTNDWVRNATYKAWCDALSGK
ncbi:MAG: endo-1,4-beta-xylanase [Bacteroidaceae bacterium]|nr:endo-1,4-beta-xylanase [Bacteroidaceae bacterium]